MGKIYCPERYARRLFAVLAVIGINKFTQPESSNTIEKIIILDTIPQVNNYNETDNVKYNFEDPMHNVYRKMGIEPNNYNTPEELHNAVKEEYNKLLNK